MRELEFADVVWAIGIRAPSTESFSQVPARTAVPASGKIAGQLASGPGKVTRNDNVIGRAGAWVNGSEESGDHLLG